MKKPFRFSLIARLALIFLSVLPLSAQVPMLLEYDGFREVKGKPVNGSQTMQVKIYDAAKGGKVLYTENVGKVNVTNGEFYFTYGGAGAGIASALQGSQHWLAVVVNTKEQSPRIRLLPVPFALRSADAQSLSTQVGTLATSVLATQVQSSTLSSNVTSLQAQNTALSSNLTAVKAQITAMTATGETADLKQLLITLGVIPVYGSNVTVTTLAGSGSEGFADGTGTAAQFQSPNGVAVDSSGNVYVADSGNQRIRKITPQGVVTTLAGSGAEGFADGTGTAAQFYTPSGVAVDSGGNVYVADYRNHRIRKITPQGVVTTLAGSGAEGFSDGTGTAAQFNSLQGVAVDSSGNVYVTDSSNNRIRKITPNPWSVSAESGKYLVNDELNPSLKLVRGDTYTFSINASGHPFWIKTAPTTGDGDSYNVGVVNNGTDNGTISFVVPYDAPSTLYYRCAYHSSMAGTFNVVDAAQ